MKRNSQFSYFAPVAQPREVPTSLPRTEYKPQKDRAWQAMAERIRLDVKTLSFGKK